MKYNLKTIIEDIEVNDFVKNTSGQFYIFQVIKVTDHGVYDQFNRFCSFAIIEKLSDDIIKNLGLKVR